MIFFFGFAFFIELRNTLFKTITNAMSTMMNNCKTCHMCDLIISHVVPQPRGKALHSVNVSIVTMNKSVTRFVVNAPQLCVVLSILLGMTLIWTWSSRSALTALQMDLVAYERGSSNLQNE